MNDGAGPRQIPDRRASSSLSRSASRGAGSAAAGQLVRLVVQTAGIVVLARLLRPADYGVFALAIAVTNFGELFRDFGLANASVQAKVLLPGERDNLFWTSSAIGAVLALLLLVLSPVASASLGQPHLGPVLAVLSVNLLMSGIVTQPRASLVRDMRFGVLNVIDTAALLIGTLVGVIAAAAGWSYWSLVLMLLTQSALAAAAVMLRAGWLPRLPSPDVSIRPFLRFGLGQFGAQVLGYAARNASVLIIGGTLGLVPLGLYNRANQLLNLPLAQMQAPATQVALPTLSRLQDDPDTYDRFLVRGQLTLLHVTTLALALSAAIADPVFGVVLGPRWLPAAPIFQLLALSGFAMVANYATYWVFLSRGLMASNFRLSLVTQPFTIVALLLGSLGGITGILVASIVANLLIWPFTLLWLRRITTLPTRTLFANTARALCAYGSAAAVAGTACRLFTGPLPWEFLIGSGVFVLVVLIWLAAASSFRASVIEVATTARTLVRR